VRPCVVRVLRWVGHFHATFIRYRFRKYNDVFTGTELIDFLITMGVVADRCVAVLHPQPHIQLVGLSLFFLNFCT
jgi:hypothetical protein